MQWTVSSWFSKANVTLFQRLLEVVIEGTHCVSVQRLDLSTLIYKIPVGLDHLKSFFGCLKAPLHCHCAQVTLKNKARGKRKDKGKKKRKANLVHSLFFFFSSCGLRAGFAPASVGRLGIWNRCGNEILHIHLSSALFVTSQPKSVADSVSYSVPFYTF